MIVVYEQFGIAFNLGLGNWTTVRKVNIADPANPNQSQPGIIFDYAQPGHAIPYESEAERDSHWDRIIGLLRQQSGVPTVVGASQLPSNLSMLGVERR